jgi:spore coat polysaccharide biosynthesis protein SpsF
MKTVIVTQARYGSSRFPGKILKKIGNRSLLQIHLERLKRSKQASQVFVATTHEVEAKEILSIAVTSGCSSYQGSLHDVLDRFYQAVKDEQPDVVVRVTSDCPLNDPQLIDEMVEVFKKSDLDYLSNVHPPTFPDGIDIEIFTFAALEKAWSESENEKDREHVTHYFYTHPEFFKLGNFPCGEGDFSKVRLTVDYPEDFLVFEALVSKIGDSEVWRKYAEILKNDEMLVSLNQSRKRNEGF